MTPPISIDVAVDDLATGEELRAIEAAFRDIGFDVRAKAVVGRKSAEALEWVVYVVLGAPIAAFFSSMATEAGKDSYSALRTWIEAIRAARCGAGTGSGSVVLRDPNHTNVVLGSGIPEEALGALRCLDWGEVRGDYLVWDHEKGAWLAPVTRPSSDEKQQP